MAILTQNDLDIFAAEYGSMPWDYSDMTFDGYMSMLKKKVNLPNVFFMAAKNQQKQLSKQTELVGVEQGPLMYPMSALSMHTQQKKKQQQQAPTTIPLLSSYAVRTA